MTLVSVDKLPLVLRIEHIIISLCNIFRVRTTELFLATFEIIDYIFDF